MTELDDKVVHDSGLDGPYRSCYGGREGSTLELGAYAFTGGSRLGIERAAALSVFRKEIKDVIENHKSGINGLFSAVDSFILSIDRLYKELHLPEYERGVPRGWGRDLVIDLSSGAFLEALGVLREELRKFEGAPQQIERRIEISAAHPAENPARILLEALDFVNSGINALATNLDRLSSSPRISGPATSSERLSEATPEVSRGSKSSRVSKSAQEFDTFKNAVLGDHNLVQRYFRDPCNAIAGNVSALQGLITDLNGLQEVGKITQRPRDGCLLEMRKAVQDLATVRSLR